MNKERLLKLADYLEKVVAKTPELFDMRDWSQETDCGTVCCAIGHACNIPQFKKAGLRLIQDCDDPDVTFPFFGGHEGFEGVGLFFGIHWRDAERLFGYCDSTLAEVVEKIRGFANSNS